MSNSFRKKNGLWQELSVPGVCDYIHATTASRLEAGVVPTAPMHETFG